MSKFLLRVLICAAYGRTLLWKIRTYRDRVRKGERTWADTLDLLFWIVLGCLMLVLYVLFFLDSILWNADLPIRPLFYVFLGIALLSCLLDFVRWFKKRVDTFFDYHP